MRWDLKSDNRKTYLNYQSWKGLEMREEVWRKKLWNWLEECKWGGGWGKGGRNSKGSVTIRRHLFVSNPSNYESTNDDKVLLFSFLY